MNNTKIEKDFIEGLNLMNLDCKFSSIEAVLRGEEKLESKQTSLNPFIQNVLDGYTRKYRLLYSNFILNHTTYKLSDLDLEMIHSVPQGGNWKDIPMEVVAKSKRLKRITETGGRTTLYGRIDYQKPSYTITTYFNRPGNGTYVHPTHDRVLSVREAARFQSFKDDYYFYGNKTQILKEVGNAVPPLLAYQIAKQIRLHTDCSKTVDLFCGAGGMTTGFKAAGIFSTISNDIEASACTTLKINNPEINVLHGDVTLDEIKSKIEEVAISNGADMICGGPPCQGFSLAGFRSSDDPRNQLFRDFVELVKRINPKVIVFENVVGLLSYQKGKTYKELHQLFNELGYFTEGRVLSANHFAVPQKRKRVIVICTRNDINVSPDKLFPRPVTINENDQITAKETIYDLEAIPCSDYATYTSEYTSDMIEFLRGKKSYDELLETKSNQTIHQLTLSELI